MHCRNVYFLRPALQVSESIELGDPIADLIDLNSLMDKCTFSKRKHMAEFKHTSVMTFVDLKLFDICKLLPNSLSEYTLLETVINSKSRQTQLVSLNRNAY